MKIRFFIWQPGYKYIGFCVPNTINMYLFCSESTSRTLEEWLSSAEGTVPKLLRGGQFTFWSFFFCFSFLFNISKYHFTHLLNVEEANIYMQVFAFVKSDKSIISPHRADCHVCECTLEFRTKVEVIRSRMIV